MIRREKRDADMDLLMAQYIESNVIAIVMLSTMLTYAIGTHRVHETRDRRLFIRMLVFNIVILSADIGIYLVRGHAEPAWVLLDHLLCVVYFVMEGWFGYAWACYSLQRLHPDYLPSEAIKAVLFLPCFVNSLLAAASPFTGWLYYLSAENRYHRGPYMWVAFALVALYWLFSAVLALAEAKSPNQIHEAAVYRALLIFPLPAFIGNLLQMRFYGISVVWVCSAISLLVLFITLQNNQLSRDTLTGLFNRRQTHIQLAWEIEHCAENPTPLFAAMVDVDFFKSINDRCGHLAGDQALVQVAEILKNSCRKKDFIGRFGGDEFLILGHVENEPELEAMLEHILEKTAETREKQQFPYALSLSIGYTICRPQDGLTVDAVLNAADHAMYEAKKKRHAQGRPR